MNTENIEVGMVVKNYKELCTLLDEKVTTGKGKQLQIENWTRYFDFERDGNKYIIKKVYNMPLAKAKPDKAKKKISKNDIYTRYIQVILTKHLKETNQSYYTTTDLLKLFGFVNDNWGNMELLFKFTNNHNCTYKQAKYYYNQLYMRVMSYCVTAFKRCLGRLSQRKYINWYEVYRVCDIYGDGKISEERNATKSEIDLYTEISYKLKEEMRISYINMYNAEEYYNRLNEELKEYNMAYMHKAIGISFAKSGIDKAILVSEQEYKNAIKEVNGKSLTQMKNYIDIDIESCVAKITDEVNKAFDNSDEDYSYLPNVREDVIKNELDKIGIDYMKDNKTDLTNMYIELFI